MCYRLHVTQEDGVVKLEGNSQKQDRKAAEKVISNLSKRSDELSPRLTV